MRLDQYMKELNRVQLLEPEEERALWQAFKEENDTAARQRLIESYQPLVFKQAMPFRSLDNIMDIIQEGTVGLIEAVENYDYRRGVAFSLYAVHRIRGRILNFVKKEGGADIACIDGAEEQPGRRFNISELVDDAAPLPEQTERKFLAEQLQAALARLPQKERQVISSVYLEQQEAKDVAAALAVSPSHIYRLQKTGIRRIRGMLSKFMQQW